MTDEKPKLVQAVEKSKAEREARRRAEAVEREVAEFIRDAKLNIYQRILCVMGELDYVQKSGSLKFKDRGGYQREFAVVLHDDVTAALHPLFFKYGIVPRRTVVDVQHPTQESPRVALTVLSEYINADQPADRLSVTTIGYGEGYGDKGPGSAFSYAVKYADLKTLMLATGEDEESQQALRGRSIKPEQASHLARLAEKAGVEPAEIQKFLLEQHGEEVESFGQIPANRYMSILTLIENRAKGQGDE